MTKEEINNKIEKLKEKQNKYHMKALDWIDKAQEVNNDIWILVKKYKEVKR